MSAANSNAERPGGNAPEFSVSELSGAIKRALEDGFSYVRLKGEISGYRGPHSSGHCYFALKDDKAKIEAVIWKGSFARLRFRPEEGMEVIAQGKITTFPGSSKYQIVIDALEPAGAGALMALLEERRRKFAAEGLFNDARKKPRPFLPRIVGIITSPTGAVIRDMLHGFEERFPTRVLIWPVRVQGEGSAAEIANAIRGFNALPEGGAISRPDVLIVARGGGSLEDLWSFNEEIVVRATADSRIPLISAVGHETDWTLIDLVADARAPTPTKAAEWAVPKHSELIEAIEKFSLRQRTAMRRVLEGHRVHLKAAERGLPWPQDLVALPRQRFDAATARLSQALTKNTQVHTLRHSRVSARLQPRVIAHFVVERRRRLDDLAWDKAAALRAHAGRLRLAHQRAAARLVPSLIAARTLRLRDRLAALEARAIQALSNRTTARRRAFDGQAALLASLSYHSVLARGFALVRDAAGRTVRHATAVAPRESLSIEFVDGRIAATADVEPQPLTSDADKQIRARPGSRDKGKKTTGQGSLF